MSIVTGSASMDPKDSVIMRLYSTFIFVEILGTDDIGARLLGESERDN